MERNNASEQWEWDRITGLWAGDIWLAKRERSGDLHIKLVLFRSLRCHRPSEK